MKKILCLLIAMFGIVTCVNAANYTEYKVGDEIEVNLNATQKSKFIVIKDSDSSTREVVAIYKDTIPDAANYQNDYTYEQSVAKIESLNTEWNYVTKVSHPTMEELFGEKFTNADEAFNFTDPKWLIVKLRWWTSTEGKTETSSRGHWTVGSTLLQEEGSTGVFDDSYTLSIRPVINVNKDYVVGGVSGEIEEQEQKAKDTIWEDFVEKYKNTEYLKKIINLTASKDVTVSHTDNAMTVLMKDGDIIRETKFEYDDGILTYIPSTDDAQNVASAPFVFNCLYAISDLKGYDAEKINEWVLNNPDSILPKDGVEYEILEVSLGENGNSLTSDVFKSFKLHIKNGLSNYDISNPTTPPEIVPDNPHTGTERLLLTISELVILGIIFVIVKKQKAPLSKIK